MRLSGIHRREKSRSPGHFTLGILPPWSALTFTMAPVLMFSWFLWWLTMIVLWMFLWTFCAVALIAPSITCVATFPARWRRRRRRRRWWGRGRGGGGTTRCGWRFWSTVFTVQWWARLARFIITMVGPISFGRLNRWTTTGTGRGRLVTFWFPFIGVRFMQLPGSGTFFVIRFNGPITTLRSCDAFRWTFSSICQNQTRKRLRTAIMGGQAETFRINRGPE